MVVGSGVLNVYFCFSDTVVFVKPDVITRSHVFDRAFTHQPRNHCWRLRSEASPKLWDEPPRDRPRTRDIYMNDNSPSMYLFPHSPLTSPVQKWGYTGPRMLSTKTNLGLKLSLLPDPEYLPNNDIYISTINYGVCQCFSHTGIRLAAYKLLVGTFFLK